MLFRLAGTPAGKRNVMNFNLKPLAVLLPVALISSATATEQAVSLDQLVVTATRQATRTSELLSDVSTIEADELRQAGQSPIGQILARQPGVEFSSTGSPGGTSSIFMRGTSPGHTLVLVDGMRVGSASLGQMAAWSRIPANQIERIEILRGPASSLYGSDAIGGVIQIFTRQGKGPLKVQAESGVGSNDTNATNAGFSGSQGNLRYALNAGTYRTGGFNSTRNPANRGYNSDRDRFDNVSISGSMAYEFAKGHEAGTSVFYSDGESQYDSGTTKATAARDYRNQLAVSSANTYLKNTINDHWISTVRLGRSTDDAKNTIYGTQNSLFRTDQTQYIWQNDIKTNFGSLLIGLERLDQSVTGTGNYKSDQRSIDSVLAGWRGVYNAHSLQANARHDQNSQFGDRTTGSVAYGYRLNSNWRANASYGTAFKAPSFNDLYYPLTGNMQGNPNLLPESSRNREASIHYTAGLHHVSLTWFLNRVENLISWSNTPINIGNARIEGSTLAYEGQIGSFNLAANYNYVDPRDADTGRYLSRRASNYGSASIGQQLGPWDWRVEFQASDRRFDKDDNIRKLSGYTLTNLYGAYRFSGDWSVFARVNNLFDRNYEVAADYATAATSAFIGLRYSQQ